MKPFSNHFISSGGDSLRVKLDLGCILSFPFSLIHFFFPFWYYKILPRKLIFAFQMLILKWKPKEMLFSQAYT
jgi:hypothetical protein